MSRCLCGAEVRWCEFIEGGGNICLNVAPEPGGSYRVAGADSAMLVAAADRVESGRYYRPHPETCSRRADVAAFRREQHRAGNAAAKRGRTRAIMNSLGDGPLTVWKKPT